MAKVDLLWCPGCQEYKPSSEMTKSKNRRYGYGPYCKECTKLRSQSPEARLRASEYRRKYYREHKTYFSEYNRIYRSKNAEKLREYERNRPNKKERREQDRKYRASLPIEVKRARQRKRYLKHKEKQIARQKEYYHTEEGKRKHKTWQSRYRAKKAGLVSDFTPEQWDLALTRWNRLCAYCQKESATDQDHFVPISKNGGYTRSNIVPACDHCNSSKRNLDAYDWAEYEGIPEERIDEIKSWLSENSK